MTSTLDLTRQLLSRASVSPDDAGCQELLIARLEPLGFKVERLRFGDVDNFWAHWGSGPGPLLCFAGHTDVVPTGPLEHWHSDPFQPVIREGLLFGRGAADMKSGLAAMVTAAEEFITAQQQIKGAIAFLITSDEEGPSVDGTRRVVELLAGRDQRVDFCVVGEPSSQQAFGDTIRIGRRGSLSGRLTVHGKQGHVAYPDLADNPIHRAAPVIADLAARAWDQGNEHFPPTSFQISNLNAGTGASNVIPGELHARFNLRWSPVQSPDGLKAGVAEILDRHRLRYTLAWSAADLPYYCPPRRLAPIAQAAVQEVAGRIPEMSTGGGTSDGRFFAPLGAEIIELGVCNRTIHMVDECCRVEDIDLLHRTYVSILRRVFAAG